METVLSVTISIMVAIIVSTVSPIVLAYFGETRRSSIRKDYALTRFREERYYRKGVVLASIKQAGQDSVVVGECVIHDIDKGRIEIRDLTDAHAMTWTLREFEAMDPVVDLTHPDTIEHAGQNPTF